MYVTYSNYKWKCIFRKLMNVLKKLMNIQVFIKQESIASAKIILFMVTPVANDIVDCQSIVNILVNSDRF